jgi:methylmalonyl-CoA/ethylmalonyl-CoA epimerase
MAAAHHAVLDHVALAVEKVADAPDFLVGELGARPAGGGPGPGYAFWQWLFANDGRLEVLEPSGPPGGFVHRFLASRGPGIHHVTFKVPRIEDAIARLEAADYQVVGVSLEKPAWKEAFLHPKQAQGVVVQLAESNPELAPAEWAESRWPFPELPAPAPEAARMIGVRLVARSEQRARHQWQDALLGECSHEDGRDGPDGLLLFRWPDSPLRVAVRVDPAAEEGPEGLEFAPRPGAPLPEAGHHALGARLLTVPTPR